MARAIGVPKEQGLYRPETEKDNCGIGLVANIKGIKSHDIIKKGIRVLEKIEHRGAVGADPLTGDGAGMLMQMPDAFFREVTKEIDIELPEIGNYGVGMIFLPQDENEQKVCKEIVEKIIIEEGQQVLGWREVPVDTNNVGKTAELSRPVIKQVFINKGCSCENFELRLYFIRKRIEKMVSESSIMNKAYFYITSLSARVIVYKGLLLADQVGKFYTDFNNETMVSAIALVHQRYSTNTFPSWDLAQPFRFLAHNGEINTIKGNVTWMEAREAIMSNEVFGDEIEKLFPLHKRDGSDSANLDNALEFLVASGKSLLEAANILVPRAWEKDSDMDEDLKAFYEYYSGLMEPWDGPASLAMTDGSQIVAMLDRNGLRPARYLITEDDELILASEAGTLEIPFDKIRENGRLQPGKVLVVDTIQGRILEDKEVVEKLANSNPYGEWIAKNKRELNDIPVVGKRPVTNLDTVVERMRKFGFGREDLQTVIGSMITTAKEPIGSMGNDAALAVLSDKSKDLFSYFQQLFAQVTNPPIDPIREQVVMSVTTQLGVKGNILEDNEDKARTIKLNSPILKNCELDKIASLDEDGFNSVIIPMEFDLNFGLEKGLELMVDKAEAAIDNGANILILSDRNIQDGFGPIPSLLATGCMQHKLLEGKKRNGIDLIIETGEAREVYHMALLIGYGALAVNPYLAFEAIEYMADKKIYTEIVDVKAAFKVYVKACNKGLEKVMSKMGIASIQSYRGAQIFEAVGLAKSVVDKYFKGTASRIEGIDIKGIEREVIERLDSAAKAEILHENVLPNKGEFKWRKEGEKRLFSPEAIAKLQDSTKKGDYEEYKEYAQLINDQSKRLATIRGLFKFKKGNPILIDEVQPVDDIVKRFVTGAMSYGSISQEAHEAMAIAMNTLGGMSNSGEGGENPERFKDNRRSAIKQIASGRFGVTTHYLVNADELQIKMAQGAKPGEGGHLPGHKVTETIAATRHTSPGIDLISPPPHHDIYSIEDLAQLIYDLKNVNERARVSVKLVSEVGVGTVAAGVSKAHADMILIAGYDGGTGAAPLSSIKHAGLPWELGLSEAHQVLVLNDLRGRVRVQADGQMKTGRDVVIAAMLGAEEFGFATAPLVVLGCIMMRVCHTNMCPVGVATQSEELRKKFLGKSEYLINFFRFIAQDVREIMAELGFKHLDEMVGRSDMIEMNDAIDAWKANGIDISAILHKPEVDSSIATRCVQSQDHGLEKILDRELIKKSANALENGEKVEFDTVICNENRTTGTMLSGEIAKKYGGEGLPEDTIKINFTGVAGQSFGTFGMSGITYNLTGQANDYIGKGLFGGKIIVKAPKESKFAPENNVIGGNTVLFGAIRGQAYLNGMVGERFCVRNSGAKAVVEAIGDHGCEYMTGGRVAVLGKTGRNFGAGMSGGIAYVYDIDGKFETRVNRGMVITETVTENNDISILKELIENHAKYTDSKRAKEILADWDNNIKKFVKVVAPKYKELLAQGKVK